MAPIITTCRYAACDVRVSLDSPTSTPCENCLGVPNDDINGPLTNHNYCSEEHKGLDRSSHHGGCELRQARRLSSRTAAIIEAMYKANRTNLVSCVAVASRKAIVKSEACRIVDVVKADLPTPSPNGSIPYEAVMGASCFEDCQMAIVRTTLALGWLLRGRRFAIHEHHGRPEKTRQIRVRHVDPGTVSQSREPSGLHSFISVSPFRYGANPDNGIVMDHSSMQYENPLKTHTLETYCLSSIKVGTLERAKPYGTAYRTWSGRSMDSEPSIERCDVCITFCSIQRSNRVVYNWAKHYEGLDDIFSMPHHGFMTALADLTSRLNQELHQLGSGINEFCNQNPTNHLGALKNLAAAEHNEAHDEIMQAGFEMSRKGARITPDSWAAGTIHL